MSVLNHSLSALDCTCASIRSSRGAALVQVSGLLVVQRSCIGAWVYTGVHLIAWLVRLSTLPELKMPSTFLQLLPQEWSFPLVTYCNTPIKVTFYLEDSLLTERLSPNL
jgi:hypothetical protein